MIVFEKITCSRKLSCHYIEIFMLFKAVPHKLLRLALKTWGRFIRTMSWRDFWT